jgi:hypothetical protein
VLLLLAVVLLAAQDEGPRFSAWSQAVPVGSPIRTVDNYEACPFISKSGLDLYFRTYNYDADNDVWHFDIYVSHRDTVDDPWEDPINLGPNVNTGKNEYCSFVTTDGHWLYFVSTRTGTKGGQDLWVSHRKDKRNDTGWDPPINLGSYVNSEADDNGPSIFEDEATGQVTLYFTRTVSGRYKIYSCPMLDKVTVGPAAPVEGLNMAGVNDWHAFVRRKDGLEVIFSSSRADPAAQGGSDLYVSTRPTTHDPWSTPVNLGPDINSARNEARPSISWDGTTLYFWTNREPEPGYPGCYWIKLYQATRDKIIGKDK